MNTTTAMGELASDAGYDLPLKVIRSGAGYYIGTFSVDAGPVSRESEEYWPTEELADAAMASGAWTQGQGKDTIPNNEIRHARFPLIQIPLATLSPCASGESAARGGAKPGKQIATRVSRYSSKPGDKHEQQN